MELDERKAKILKSIIRNYLETGEPVGSRTISKDDELNLSSATIRNEMADLEEMGLIMQPHTSAGRIPTDKGYRLYVDELMEEERRESKEERNMLIERVDKLETLLTNLAKMLAANTNYTTLVSAPQTSKNKLRFLQLSKVDENSVLAVIMLEGNMVKNTIIKTENVIDEQIVLKLNLLLNSFLTGLSIEDINLGLMTKLKAEAGEYSTVVEELLGAISQMLIDSAPQIYTSGATNIFKYPELTEGEKASELINAFEEKEALNELVTTSMQNKNENEIQIYIGNESPVQSMKDCSVVTASYELGEGMTGVIGIVGPKRMDYEKVVGTLRDLMHQLDTIYKNK
ncbi:MAG: heat-inducible transcription repressor HrcA [Lachnospiraceae bacterium]|jgi:heat-inducible transcriptional repressor|nr:heat-inducible transcription repressor HrcA [Lachnospiraceae bacterium]